MIKTFNIFRHDGIKTGPKMFCSYFWTILRIVLQRPLRRLGSQQINHQIFAKLLKYMYLSSFNEENSMYSSLVLIFCCIFIQSFSFQGDEYGVKIVTIPPS